MSDSESMQESEQSTLRLNSDYGQIYQYIPDPKELNSLIQSYASYWTQKGSEEDRKNAPKIPQLKIKRKMAKRTSEADKVTEVMETLAGSFESSDLTSRCSDLMQFTDTSTVTEEDLNKRLSEINDELKNLQGVEHLKKFELGHVIDFKLSKNPGNEAATMKDISSFLGRSTSYLYKILKFYRVIKDHQRLLFCNVSFRFYLINLATIEEALKKPEYHSEWNYTYANWRTAETAQL